MLQAFVRTCERALGNQDGTAAVVFAVAVPVVFGVVGVGVDYSLNASMRGNMQAVADSAAIASAREFQIAKSDASKIAAVARAFVVSKLPDVNVTTNIDSAALTVEVVLQTDVPSMLTKFMWDGSTHIKVAATAKMSGGLPLCLVALDPKAPGTIKLQKVAHLSAPNCMVYSNSTSSQGLISLEDAVLQAGVICSAGGRLKTKNTNYSPDPLTDCPPISDPLASRSAPAEGACSYNGKVVNGMTVRLSPGVYCGGLTVTNGAVVTLAPGIHVFKDGPLVVGGNAELKGVEVALQFKGAGANLTFETQSTISLTGPKDGPLAGILIYDDPTGAPAPEKPGQHAKAGASPREHQILSDNARMLLGTIYMPKGRLIVDATKPVADRSAYTVLVVQQLDLYDGPNLVLNTDYSASDIPVPAGVGPYGGKVMLTN